MKPLLIIEIPAETPRDNYNDLNDMFAELQNKSLKDYTIIVLHGAKGKAYYPCNFITYLFQKIKTWLILKTAKKRLS